MRSFPRRWSLPVLACLVAVLAGCGADVDLARTTYQRTTVPAGADLGGSSGRPPAPGGEDAFKSPKLRLVNPCGLLDDDTLAAFGEPANSRLRDYVLCSNYMKDTKGKELNFTLTLGDVATGRDAEGDLTIGGLPAGESELDDKTACFVTAITETDPTRGITVQVGGGEPGNLCDPGRKLLEAVVNRIRSDPPALDLAKGSLVDLEPCTILDDSVVAAAIGDSASKRPTGLHVCNWNASGVALSLSFRIGPKPDDLAATSKTEPVDLGSGVLAQQKYESTSGVRCRVEWAHVAFPEDAEKAEVISLDFSRYTPQQGEDPCGKLQAVAKALIPKLPAK
ncbi:DUF3558 family protein [Actinokineospora sp.]|uniref:DUF3558 family protein n=1 Tax=Actinokineospora sp. TaxID=1872133 RepID=UPI004037B14A